MVSIVCCVVYVFYSLYIMYYIVGMDIVGLYC